MQLHIILFVCLRSLCLEHRFSMRMRLEICDRQWVEAPISHRFFVFDI